MKKRGKWLALALVAALAVTTVGCGSGKKESKGEKGASEEIKDLVTYEVPQREMENVFILNTEMAADLNVLCNTNEGFLETNPKGQLVAGIAKEWGTEDNGLTWTFKMRDDVKWVDQQGNEKADMVADDFVTALEWILNAHKNDAGNNTSMPISMIKGAKEYREYTKSLSADEALKLDKSKFLEMVGIETPDDYTVVYHCIAETPYFDTVAVSACLYPISQGFIDEVGVENVKSVGIDKLWYNGPYILTEFIQGNTKTLTKNESYWDKDCKLFDTVTIKLIEDLTVGYSLYDTGEIDTIDLAEANLRAIYEDENNQYHDYLTEKLPKIFSYQMKFNYAKKNEDGSDDTNWNTAIANEAFRQSIYYGLDLTKTYERANMINPLSCENTAYTMKGLVYFSDGTEYVDRVEELIELPESNGKTMRRLDKEKAEELKKQAIEELSAKGVKFPVEMDYYIPAGSQLALDSATVLQENFAEFLGDDYIKLNIGTYVSSLTQEVIDPSLQSVVMNGWGADYGDVQNFLGQETYGEETAYYSMNYTNINDATDPELIATWKEFTDLVNKANAITGDLDERYEAYAQAEAYMLKHAMTIPYNLDISWQLSKINDYSVSHAIYGMQNAKYKDWETSVDAYTTEDYEKFAEEFNK